ncbi:MAG: serine hydroxymethyltransferase [Proteobacteria bacterium]|nr:serine hydroxymethyltransferase [Pseudomonadota bacterium]
MISQPHQYPTSYKPWSHLKTDDPEVYSHIEAELHRQRYSLEMIASENFVCQSILAGAGNPLTNKYAEGLPHKRYYGGCEHIDAIESLAISRACSLFSCHYANVQPHSGASANNAVFLALLQPGDRILGLDLSHGGHLTHGSPVNISGMYFQAHCYGVDPQTELLDYDIIRERAKEVQPQLIIAGASAYPRVMDFAAFANIAKEVGAYLLVDMAHIAGLVAAGLHPSPLPHAHVTTTTTHKTLRGPRGGMILWNDNSLSAKLNKGVFPGTQGGPLEHIIAMKATCFHLAHREEFQTLQQKTIKNAQAFATTLKEHGCHLVTGGTDNHLILLNLLHSNLTNHKDSNQVTGKDLEAALDQVHITTNKNTVPGEKRSPFVTSGVRFGSPALTSRGLLTQDFKLIAKWVAQILESLQNQKTHDTEPPCFASIRKQVKELCSKYPLYPEW